MKSIKKKAEEYAFIKQGIDSVGIKFIELNTNKQDGFEAGANYVLEHFENILQDKNTIMVKFLMDMTIQMSIVN